LAAARDCTASKSTRSGSDIGTANLLDLLC